MFTDILRMLFINLKELYNGNRNCSSEKWPVVVNKYNINNIVNSMGVFTFAQLYSITSTSIILDLKKKVTFIFYFLS